MKIILMLMLALMLTACGKEPEPAVEAANDPLATWQPDIDGPITELESLLQTLNQQQHINRVAGQIATLYDVKLYQLYLRTLALMDADASSALQNEQRQWLEERLRISRAAAEQFRSGSIASFISSQAFIDETRARIDALTAEYHQDNE